MCIIWLPKRIKSIVHRKFCMLGKCMSIHLIFGKSSEKIWSHLYFYFCQQSLRFFLRNPLNILYATLYTFDIKRSIPSKNSYLFLKHTKLWKNKLIQFGIIKNAKCLTLQYNPIHLFTDFYHLCVLFLYFFYCHLRRSILVVMIFMKNLKKWKKKSKVSKYFFPLNISNCWNCHNQIRSQ